MDRIRPLLNNFASARGSFGRDALASVVVFLVALPLCMGIAIASGVPPALGLVSGVIGGLVVGTLAGSPLQVSGPAAGLAVMVWELVQRFGLSGLGVAVVVAGGLQILAGTLRVGRWFRAVSPAVVQGMLAGIGVLIFASQFHVMVDDKPRGDGITNLLAIPQAVALAWQGQPGTTHAAAAGLGAVTILTILLWNTLRQKWKSMPTALRSVPGPLVAVVTATALATGLDLVVKTVDVPARLTDALALPTAEAWRMLLQPSFLAAALALGIIASAESLLCAGATDQMHDGPRTRYDKELVAQGTGNVLAGLLGALPITGVIVRSTANIEAGAKTRLSGILHGVWILVFVAALPFVLQLVPTASLAGILVYTGYKLVNPAIIAKLKAAGHGELAIYVGTLAAVVATDLLTGVLFGLGLALVRMLIRLAQVEVKVVAAPGRADRVDVFVGGAATFLGVPRLAEALDALPPKQQAHIHLAGARYLDHACREVITGWAARYDGQAVVWWQEAPADVLAEVLDAADEAVRGMPEPEAARA